MSLLRARCATTGEKLPRWHHLPRHEDLPVTLYVGLPGGGKSLAMTRFCLYQMAAGKRVWTNYPLWHRPLGLRAGYVDSWDAFLQVAALPGRDKVIAIQEGGNLCNARDWAQLPSRVRDTWNTIRHFGVHLVMDAQHEEKVDKALRQVVQYVLISEPTWFKNVLGWRVYRHTLTTAELAARCRSALAVGDLTQSTELNVVPPGDSQLVSIPGWMHVCYDTHAHIESWPYTGEGEALPPTYWDGTGWLPVPPSIAP